MWNFILSLFLLTTLDGKTPESIEIFPPKKTIENKQIVNKTFVVCKYKNMTLSLWIIKEANK